MTLTRHICACQANLAYCGNPNATQMVECVQETLGCGDASLRGSVLNVAQCIRDRSYVARSNLLCNAVSLTCAGRRYRYYLVDLATVNDDIWINLCLPGSFRTRALLLLLLLACLLAAPR